jgi:hypothetical protein
VKSLIPLVAIFIISLIPANVIAQVQFEGSYTTSNAHRIRVENDRAAVLDGSSLLLLDVSTPSTPTYLSSIPIPGQPSGLDIRGSYVYVASGDSGMLVIDISTPTDPHWVGRYFGEFASINVAARDTICYLMEFKRVTIISVADPANPREIAHLDVNFVRNDAIAVGDNMLYLVGDVGEFELIFGYDISNPAAPYRRSYGFDFWSVSDMIIADSRLFIANATWNYISTFNIANPDSITSLSQLTIQGPTAIIPVNGLFYASMIDGGITELYCADPDTCIVLESVETPGSSRDIVNEGNFLFVADSSSVQIFRVLEDAIGENSERPVSFALTQNYPNPFNATTTISFSLKSSGPVTLEIYDLLGRKVATLANGQMQAGEHKVVWNAGGQASGAYVLSLRAENKSATRRLTLLK